MGVLVNIVIVLLVLGMTYALMSEGLWGAALMFFNALFAGLIAFNFYEPLANLVSGFGAWAQGYADTASLLGLFAVALVLLRIITESIAPAMVRFPAPVYHAGRFLFGLAGSLVTMSILLLAFHTAPVHKKIFGQIDYDAKPPFGWGLDHRWLAFFQFTSGQVFASYGQEYADPFLEYRDAKVFDPQGRWLIDHQNARPYGTETVPEGAAGEGEGGEGEGGEAEGGEAPEGGAGPPAQAGGGMGIPGGTAGAAAGLAPVNPM